MLARTCWLIFSCLLCSEYLVQLGICVELVCTWDKGECQCHPASPRDCRDRDVGGHCTTGPPASGCKLLQMLLQKAREKRETAEYWKVVFVGRPCPHTVVQSLVQLGAFSHWQTPVWWKQDRIATAVSTLQPLLPWGDPSFLKKHYHWCLLAAGSFYRN